MKHKEFTIPFSGLKQGRHGFEYDIENKFFESFGYDEFKSAHVKAKVILEKMSTMMELFMEASGTINLHCDLTNEPYDQEIESSLKLVIKFGEEFNDEDDEIVIIPYGDYQINIAQYLYEMLVLSVPQKRIHPGVLDGTLKSDVLGKLDELRPKENIDNTNKTDPRWDALKNLRTDN